MATPPRPGPRGGEPERPSGFLSRFPKLGSPLIYVLLLGGTVLLFQSLFRDAGVRKVGYSEFKDSVRAGHFSRVQVAPDWVKGFPAAGMAVLSADASKTLHVLADTPPTLATRIPGDDGLVKLLEEKKMPYEAVAPSGLGDTLWIWLLPLGVGLLGWSFMMRRMAGAAGQGPQGILSFGKTRAKIQSESVTGIGFKDVAGIDEAVEELREVVEFLRTPEKFQRLGGRIPKGVLLLGPPGTGKTLLARAVAGEAGVPFFSLSGSEFVEMFVGVGAARVRDLFAQANAQAPCIVFIDELDAVGKTRTIGVIGGQDEREQTLNQLLAEMDGFDSKAGFIVIAATNRPEILDSALLRPGRFDRQVVVDRPDRRGREKILEIHARAVKLGPDADLKEVAARTPGFAGADLASVINEAALLAARKNHQAVLRSDIEEAIERVVAGLEKKNRRMNEREKDIVAHHEAGHAVVGWALPHADRVHKVSIIPRGLAAMGYTLSLPLEDRYLMSFEELRDRLAAMMGGRAAEELFIGAISTGASSDFKQATDIARLMVREYGMSALGPQYFGQERHPFLRSAGAAELQPYSEHTAELIDDEVRRFVNEALERARSTLDQHRDKAERLAARLLATEVVEEDELLRVLGPKVAPPAPLGEPAHQENA